MSLTGKERLFIEEYLIDMNPAQAYVRAGFPKTKARQKALALLKETRVQKQLEESMSKRMERLQITQDRVVEEYARIAFSNIGDYVDWNGGAITVKAKHRIDTTKLSAIQQIQENVNPTGTNISLKLYDKKAALDSLARHMGMFNDKVTVEGSVSIVDALSRARERVITAAREDEAAQDRLTDDQRIQAGRLIEHVDYEQEED